MLVEEYQAVLAQEGIEYPGSLFADYLVGAGLQWAWAVTFLRHRQLWDDSLRDTMPLLVERAAAALTDAIRGTLDSASARG